MEMMGMHKNKKLHQLFILTILLIASCEMTVACTLKLPMCIGACNASASESDRCMTCCQQIGFAQGSCSFDHGWRCYCCQDAAASRVVGPPPAATPLPPHA